MSGVVLLRGAQVIDGTRAPARADDVLVVDDRIAEVGDVSAPAGAREVDLGGLVLAPGFVDIHTHYDAEVLWDSDLTPSSWHGVTTVVMGNCGFAIAPARPDHRRLLTETLENVEGMSAAVLEAGIPWGFETFPEYLDVVDERPKRLNVASFLGHSALRLYVVGEESMERAATDDEIAQMERLLGDALDAGAMGFATSRAPNHIGSGGRPVPSRQASVDEVWALARVLGSRRQGVFQMAAGGRDFGMHELADVSKATGRNVTWTSLVTIDGASRRADEVVDQQASFGGRVWPQVAAQELGAQLTMVNPSMLFVGLPSFDVVFQADPHDRLRFYRDPQWREQARPEVMEAMGERWGRIRVQETEHARDLIGVALADVAAARDTTPFDVMLDLAVADDLQTRFQVVLANHNIDELAELLRDDRTIVGLSDAGAHADQLCDAGYTSRLLGEWVRDRGALDLPFAVWRVTGQPASVFGIAGRGMIRAGNFADLVAFDPDRIANGTLERRWDFPGGSDRLVTHSAGIEHMWVNGAQVRRDGADLDGVTEGRLLRARHD